MAQRSLAEQIGLAVADKVYAAAAAIEKGTNEVIAAIDDVLAERERKATPEYHININTDVDPQVAGQQVVDAIERLAKPTPSKTGGSDVVPSLRDTLSVVYDYMHGNGLLSESIDPRWVSKDRVLNGYTSTLSGEFKTHVYKGIVGVGYTPDVENV